MPIDAFTTVTNTNAPGAAQQHNIWWLTSAGNTIVRADTDGNVTTAEVEITISGNHTLNTSDFFLT